MSAATDSKHLDPFLGLPRQKKTFVAILIMTLVANMLFPILPHLGACGQTILPGLWLAGSYYQFWTKNGEWKWCVSLSGLGWRHLITTVRPSEALSLPSGMTTGYIIYLSSQIARVFPANLWVSYKREINLFFKEVITIGSCLLLDYDVVYLEWVKPNQGSFSAIEYRLAHGCHRGLNSQTIARAVMNLGLRKSQNQELNAAELSLFFLWFYFSWST